MDFEDNQRIIAAHREKYGPPNYVPPERGSSLPFFWLAYAAVFIGLALFFGSRAGG